MKNTGAGGVPCSKRRAVGWYSRCWVSNEKGSAVANHPVTIGSSDGINPRRT